jgi:hypothetical protein
MVTAAHFLSDGEGFQISPKETLMNQNNSPKNSFRKQNTPDWKKYLYGIVSAEISTTTRFCDECTQVAPLKHDLGILFDEIECPSKSIANGVNTVSDHHMKRNKRIALLFNGNFNYLTDIQSDLIKLHTKLSRYSRLFIVAYNPFLGILYALASWLGLRKAPKPNVYLTEKDLYTFARLAGYDVGRIRPCGFIPFYIPFLSNLINKVLPIVPIIRRLSLLWIVVLRPVIPEKQKPSLTILIPARNEGGNIDDAIERIPDFPGTEIEVLFVEGNSSDNTWQLIQTAVGKQNERFRISACQQPGKGKNDAVRAGFDKASGELVTILDADLTMPPEMLPRFYEAYCQGLGDFINGSRLVYPMEDEAMRPLNRIGNIIFCKLLSWVLGLSISDSLCGTKLFSLHDYKRISAWRSRFGDFDPFGDFEMLFSASELALGVIDVPIRYHARTYGETNINRFENGLELIRMTTIAFLQIFLGKIK